MRKSFASRTQSNHQLLGKQFLTTLDELWHWHQYSLGAMPWCVPGSWKSHN
jgi:hypothetical protein